MELSVKFWKYGGALILLVISSLIFTVPIMNVWVPMPFYLILLAWLTKFGFIFLTPLMYLLVLKYSGNVSKFTKIILVLTCLASVLNAFTFYKSWHYGVTYQGLEHTKTVAIENIIGFSIALTLAGYAFAKSSKPVAYLANILLFCLLSWCAFPYLGELP